MRRLFTFGSDKGERKAGQAKPSKKFAVLFLTFLAVGLFSSAVLLPAGTASAETSPDTGWLFWLCNSNVTSGVGSDGRWYFNDHNGHTGHCYAKSTLGQGLSYFKSGKVYASYQDNTCGSVNGADVTLTETETRDTTFSVSTGATVGFDIKDVFNVSIKTDFGVAWSATKTSTHTSTIHLKSNQKTAISHTQMLAGVRMGFDLWFDSPIDGHYNWQEYNAVGAPSIWTTSEVVSNGLPLTHWNDISVYC